MSAEATIAEITIRNKAHYDRIHEASTHQVAGRLRQAEAIYVELLEENPDDANALHLLGMLSHQAGNNEKGIELVERALDLVPDFPVFLNNLGHIHLRSGRLDKAESLFLNATRKAPDMAAPLYGLGECSRLRGELQKSADFLKLTLEREPGHVDAIVCLGCVHVQNGTAQNALDLFDKALQINPQHFDARFHKSRAQFLLGHYEDSIDTLTRLADEYPDNPWLYNNLGNAYMGLQDYVRAWRWYQQAVGRAPGNADFICNLAIALIEQNKLDDAVACLRHALDIAPDHNRAGKLIEQIETVAGDEP